MSRNRNRNRNGRAPKRAAGGGGASWHPDDETGILINFGFAEGDITKDGSNVVSFVAGNLGTADIGFVDHYNSESFTWVADAEGTGKPGITCGAAANRALGARNEANSANGLLSAFIAAGVGWFTIVAKIDAATTSSGRLFDSAGDWCGLRSDGNDGVIAHNNDGSADVTAAETAGEGAVHVYTWKHVGGELLVGVDGVFGEPVASGNTGSMAPQAFVADAFTGTLLRIMSDDEIPDNEATILAGLKTYYGIA